MKKKLSLAFSPCPNDTFMMYGLIHQKIDLQGIEFEFEMLDIEKLNQAAIKGTYQVTKASAAILPVVDKHYKLLASGGAFGIEGGPVLIARSGVELNENSSVAIPGEHTSAHALFNRYYKVPAKKQFVLFSEIFGLLSSGRTDAGVIIHEDRFTFWQHGFECVSDLGLEWKKETGLPVPLGVFIMRNDADSELVTLVDELIRKSVVWAGFHYDEVFPWMKEHARNEHPEIIRKHIEYYVNEYSLDMGKEGTDAIKLLNRS
jgi:1,4-dihydroxy-6-naphthoate synthase